MTARDEATGATARSQPPTETTGDSVIIFSETGDFAACRAAEQWCAVRGLSVGRMQAGSPRGLLRGNYDIQKWRNLDRDDRRALHGLMTGSMRTGPITVRVFASVEGR